MSRNSNYWDTNPYFKEKEFSCKCGCNFNNIDSNLLTMLTNAREDAKTSFIINSACRCENHNESVGGSDTSSHIKGFAVDIRVYNSVHRFKILQSLVLVGFKRIGVYKNFIHCDNDNDKVQNVIWYK